MDFTNERPTVFGFISSAPPTVPATGHSADSRRRVLTSKPWCLPNAICGMVVEIWFITSYRIKQQMFVYVCLSTPGGWTSELAVLLLGMM